MSKPKKLHGPTLLASWDLCDPDSIGSSEYRAAYELLSDCLTLDESELDVPAAVYAVGVLDELIADAQQMRKHIAEHNREAVAAWKGEQG
jgi:hypothetical protein